MPDNVYIDLGGLNHESVQILVDGVASILSAFADPGHDGPVALPPQLVRELYGVAGIGDADAGPLEQLCVETGFHAGVFATVAFVGMLIPEFRERLRERLRALERRQGLDDLLG